MLRVNRIESSRWRLYQNGLTRNELEQKARSVRGPAVLPSRALLGYAAINTASAGPPNYQPLHPAPRPRARCLTPVPTRAAPSPEETSRPPDRTVSVRFKYQMIEFTFKYFHHFT